MTPSGSFVIDSAHAHDDGAHLRGFITSDAARGRGIGRRFLQRAVEFSDACGHPRLCLWTFAGLAGRAAWTPVDRA